ncbi:MAG: hydrogenase expression/formation protein HypE [Candidatus Hydrogenedentota bacterium]
MTEETRITLQTGAGGAKMHEFLNKIGCEKLGIPEKFMETDSFTFKAGKKNYNFTTDMFVVTPLFFNGGDIGKLSVCGTVNDLITGGAKPLYLALALVIEEGFLEEELFKILKSIKDTAKEAGVEIVTGDTKVVRRGECDGCFICTTGIGEQILKNRPNPARVEDGDIIIITGTIGDHSVAILEAREEFGIKTGISSDCASLNKPFLEVFESGIDCKFLRDPTRGGLASVLNELVLSSDSRIEIFEKNVPVRKEVVGFCELTGLDYLNLANEGKMVIVIKEKEKDKTLDILKKHRLTEEADVIGRISKKEKPVVILHTAIGSTRIVPFPVGELLPRIC